MSSVKLAKRTNRTLKERLVSAQLPGGLPLYHIPKPGLTKKVAVIAARYGSLDLEFEVEGKPLRTPPGIAHFLEHQLFKKESGDVLIEFGRYGASSNAFTEYCTTAYYFTCSDRFEESLTLLLNLVTKPYFHADNVEKERQIIEQELRMYDDSPDYQVYRNLMTGLYQVHPVRLDVGGTVDDLKQIDASLLERCYRVFYHPENMVLVTAGDVDVGKVCGIAADAFVPSNGVRPPEKRVRPDEPAGVARAMTWKEMPVSRPRVLIGTKDLQVGPRAVLAQDLEMSVLLDLLFGRCGDFFARHYATGLIDDTFAATYNSDIPYGFSLIGGETDDPEALVEEVLREIARARKREIRKRDLERAKRKRLGRYIRAFDTPDGAAFLLLGCLQKGIDVFEIPKAITRITAGALRDRLHAHFDDRNYAISVAMPQGKTPDLGDTS